MASPSLSTTSSSQESFASHYDLENPLSAISTYSRLLYQHTKRQMDIVTRTSHRRSDASTLSQLSSEEITDSVERS